MTEVSEKEEKRHRPHGLNTVELLKVGGGRCRRWPVCGGPEGALLQPKCCGKGMMRAGCAVCSSIGC